MPRRRPKSRQLALEFRGRGGKRRGAGRKRIAPERMIPHVARPEHVHRHPVLVTLRAAYRDAPAPVADQRLSRHSARARLRPFRHAQMWPRVAASLDASHRDNFRIVHYSVQADHIHLLIEADDKQALSNGIRALCIRLARRLNPLLNRKGPLFGDRWHGRTLTSPRQVRNALGYVLNNYRKHANTAIRHFRKAGASGSRLKGLDHAGAGVAILGDGRDACSTAPFFTGFADKPTQHPVPKGYPDASRPPQTWLLRIGWRRAPPLFSTSIPGLSSGPTDYDVPA